MTKTKPQTAAPTEQATGTEAFLNRAVAAMEAQDAPAQDTPAEDAPAPAAAALDQQGADGAEAASGAPTPDAPVPAAPAPDAPTPDAPAPAVDAAVVETPNATPPEGGGDDPVVDEPLPIDFAHVRYLLDQIALRNHEGHRDGLWDDLKSLHQMTVTTNDADHQSLTMAGVHGGEGFSKAQSLENWANAARRVTMGAV